MVTMLFRFSLHEEVDTSRRRITFIDEEKDILEKV